MTIVDEPLDTLEEKDQWTDRSRGIGTMRTILEGQHPSKTFNRKAVLNEISFQIKAGVWGERDSAIG
ncbi:hypothetical protein ES703_82412 [subsurface metagenome]